MYAGSAYLGAPSAIHRGARSGAAGGAEHGIDRRAAGQRHLAHMPQPIVLDEATIAVNTAFGVLPELIDRERLA